MSRHDRSLAPAYFDELYAHDPDPWRFETSTYEHDKFAATLQALPQHRYSRGLEVGCSIGVLTQMLAERCDDLLALDVSSAALAQAEVRCIDQTHVRFDKRRVPDEWPDGRFDLILLSEIVYYLDRDDVRRLAAAVDAAALPGATILLVHWLGETHYPLSGDDATDLFLESTAADRVDGWRAESYRVDVCRPRRGLP